MCIRDRGVFTLPSEAEWEFACRAGTTTPFHFGETIATEQANYNGYSIYGKGKKGEFRKGTSKVGQFPPNAFGLHDMHGNVAEWCWDVYSPDLYSKKMQINPSGTTTGSKRVYRGGAFALSSAAENRSASRRVYPQDRRGRCEGFRVVLRTLDPDPKPEAKQKQ